MQQNGFVALDRKDYTRKTFFCGTHRAISPQETVNRLRHFLPVMGITRVANVTGLDYIGIPVVMVTRPNSRCLSVSQGKGLTLDAAIASGIMESIEAYHAESIQNPLKLNSYEELCYTHKMVDISALPSLSDSRFERHLRLLWVEGHDLMTGESVWIPYEMVSLDFTNSTLGSGRCFPASSNGLASGNCLFEAISHGICEVVERDSSSLWFMHTVEYNQRNRLDMSTVDDPACREVIASFDEADIFLAVWETTSDIGIPSFICVIMDRGDNPFRLMFPTSGMGCHPSREVALLRALTEAAQSRLTFIAGSRDDVLRRSYDSNRNRDILQRYRTIMMHDHGYPLRDFRSIVTWNSETFEDDINWMLKGLMGSGIKSVIVVNLSRREFDIPVVRIIVPGLEELHTVPGYVPGHRARAAMEECQ
jgi:ribosomal protein S12 methylthiotransferase accessory factor